MSISDIIQIICAAISLFVTIAFFISEKKQSTRIEKRDEKRYKESVEIQARAFIQKYSRGHDQCNRDILLLPLCPVATLYDSLYPYRREIYCEFGRLTKDVQDKVLELEKIDRIKNYVDLKSGIFDALSNKLSRIIELNYPEDLDFFYDGAKYLEDALLSFGNKIVPDIYCAADEDYKKMMEKVGKKKEKMPYIFHITNLLAWHKNERPIYSLFREETSMGMPDSDDELLTTYLGCMVAKYVAIYSDTDEDKKLIIEKNYAGHVNDYLGQKYMEDLFLEAVLSLLIHCQQYDEGIIWEEKNLSYNQVD